ncbi:ACP S-malonyltransferase [bacterium]|jgi:[acyl-carrier-protein] S-malonyltransferase|nr:ACP S-malonyltransferase [bacterium]
MTRLAICFPGQGSQAVGMGQDLYNEFDSVKTLFDEAGTILGKDIKKICFEGPEEELMQTENTQVAIFLVSVALYQQLKLSGITPSFVTGHSLGELTAYYAAGVLDLETALAAVIRRGQLMSQAHPKAESAMAAVMGMDIVALEAVVTAHDAGVAVVANYNSAAQVVISGERVAIEAVSESLKEAGAKRVIPLKVGGAFHSPLMESAVVPFTEFLSDKSFNNASVPVILDRTAQPESDAELLRSNLPEQIRSSVQWTSISQFLGKNVDVVIECGPGRVLSGLLKKTSPDLTIFSIFNLESLNTVLPELTSAVE